MFDVSKLSDILKDSPSVELLRAKNREMILIFLIGTFLENESVVSSENLHNRLADYLVSEEITIDEDSEITFADTYEEKAKKYIQHWANRGFLTNYQDETGDVFYELSSHATKTIDWLTSLKKEEYIGTESKFKTIITQLKELVEFTNEDKEKRLQLLENKKLEIEQQIQQIKMGENVKVFEEYEIIPRYNQLTKLAKELLSDFKEVEDNFKDITKTIYQKHADTSQKKGQILQYTFDALDDLKDSSQGKSFYAFWKFLLNPELQEEWKHLMQELYKTLSGKGISINDRFLEGMKKHLYLSGKKVYKANDKMAEKLSRIIRENEISKNEYAKKIIQEIKTLLIDASKIKKNPDFSFELEADAEINIPFDRKLTFDRTEEIIYKAKPQPADESLIYSDNLEKLFRTNINKDELRKRVADILKTKSQTTILEVVENHGGISDGLPEVFGYMSIVKDFKYTVNSDKTQRILFDQKNNKTIRIPEIILTQ
ncbi:MAG: DUF3375 domain-containing protein [Dysgonamonadaceae bacterium]|jgi:3-phenylpropionate/cinnamic acid dioxygenase small subunit|nr:DUF3375 domain-containing protein [Dysgonamonadaceae bacterium]